jgi:hypothetical protein
MLGRRFAGEPSVDAVDGGLIHGVENAREVILELGAGHPAHVVGQIIVRGDGSCHGHFVLMPAGEFLKTNGDALEVSAQPGRQTGDRCRVNTPERNTLNGTSATKCSRTESLTASRTVPAIPVLLPDGVKR